MEIAVMFKIVRFPKNLEDFFGPLEDYFHWDHFEYFRNLVLLITFAWGRRNISAMYRHLDEKHWHHRSRFNNLLNVFHWRRPRGQGARVPGFRFSTSAFVTPISKDRFHPFTFPYLWPYYRSPQGTRSCSTDKS